MGNDDPWRLFLPDAADEPSPYAIEVTALGRFAYRCVDWLYYESLRGSPSPEQEPKIILPVDILGHPR